jgi:CDP-glycerol glycerophosphotransferase
VTMPHTRPDVTVVVIVYNDAARIEVAVRSVLDQSLRSREVIVVDDHSTDDTPAVIERLVAENPDIVRYIRLPANSGHCGAPRNAGVKQARGQYVMFLDSDDTLDRHACRNMLAMAEASDAEMVVGRCVRHHVWTGKEQSWMPWLVQRKAVYESLSEQPGLLYDVLSTNKLYRHDFLLRENLVFLEDRHYEDNLFSAHAYLTAKRIAVIPQRVYTWNIEGKASTRSITNRAGELNNITDRIAVTQEIDKLLALRGTDELRLQKDVRFIENDLPTHLARLSRLPGPAQRALVDIARPYVRTLPPESFHKAKRLPAIAAYMVRQGDYDGVGAAHDYLASGQSPHLTTDLLVRDGRVFWCDRHLDDPLGRAVLDVTELGLQDRPLATLNLGSRILGAHAAGNRVTVTGELVNPLARITAEDQPRARLIFRDRRGARRTFAASVQLDIDERRVRWTSTFRPTQLLRPIGLLDPVYSVQLRLTAGVEATDLKLFADEATTEALRFPVRPRLTRLAADLLQGYTTDAGTVALRLAAAQRLARLGGGAITRLRRTAVGRRAWRTAGEAHGAVRRRLTQRSTQLAWYDRVFTRLPISKDTIVFESHMGKQFSDSPRAIYEELKRRATSYRPVWVYATHPAGFPSDARLVRRQSWAYLWALGRARFWVDNQGFPHDLKKRPGTTYIQTWHGSAFKRMGFDEAAVRSDTQRRQQILKKAIDRFDVFLVRSEHDVRTLTRGLQVRGELMRVGYPRNDALVNDDNQTEQEILRTSLGLTDSRRVVLYAPTFRPEQLGRGRGLVLPFELHDFVERFGEDTVLLVRPHYLTSFVLPPMYAHSVRNVAQIHDVTPLLQISDALITDYSSLMFDYALLDRPMIFHVPDYDDYVGRNRGAYFDLASTAPGPVTRTSEELFTALTDLPGNGTAFVEKRRDFVAKFGEYDTGQAAKAVVDRFFQAGARRG